MSKDDDYTDIGPVKVEFFTDSAVLLKREGGAVWVPRSQMLTGHEGFRVRDELEECFVKTWFAEKEIL